MTDLAQLCPCCRLNPSTIRQVCPDCELHQGNTIVKIQRCNSDHLRAWRGAQSSLQAKANREKELLGQQLEEARLELEKRPIKIVHENLDAETVADAESRRDKAYKSRDLTMHTLSRIRLLHRNDGKGKCACGEAYSKCKTAQVIEDDVIALDRWEKNQADRLRRGLTHFLPDNHPAVLDRRLI
jgi:hypothetical protein